MQQSGKERGSLTPPGSPGPCEDVLTPGLPQGAAQLDGPGGSDLLLHARPARGHLGLGGAWVCGRAGCGLGLWQVRSATGRACRWRSTDHPGATSSTAAGLRGPSSACPSDLPVWDGCPHRCPGASSSLRPPSFPGLLKGAPSEPAATESEAYRLHTRASGRTGNPPHTPGPRACQGSRHSPTAGAARLHFSVWWRRDPPSPAAREPSGTPSPAPGVRLSPKADPRNSEPLLRP